MNAVETVTIGANTYSVYGKGNTDPVGDADTYFGGRLGAATWTAATTDNKATALVSAFRMLNRGPSFSGSPTVDGQAGAWPRDGATCNGTAVTDGTIPDNIVDGQFELALALLEDEAIQDGPGTGSNVRRAKAGSAEVEFFRPTIGEPGLDNRYPQVVHELIGCYFAGNAASLGLFVDGTDSSAADESSSFGSCDNDYGLSEGYP